MLTKNNYACSHGVYSRCVPVSTPICCRGPIGPQGMPGPAGPQGEPGPGIPLTIFTATNRAQQTFTNGDSNMVRFPDILLNDNSPVTMQGDTVFRINTSGTYEISYHFSLAADNSYPFDVTYTLRRNGDFVFESESQGAQAYETLPPTVVMLSSTVHLFLFTGAIIDLSWRELGGRTQTIYTIANPYISFHKIGGGI